MRVTILPHAIILIKAHRAVDGCGQYSDQEEYCGMRTDSEVFLIFTTQLYHFWVCIFLFALFNDQPEVFLSEYSLPAILHAAHFRRVVNITFL